MTETAKPQPDDRGAENGRANPTPTPAAGAVENDTQKAGQPAGERGGTRGPEPTRYGDWEKNGRCFDF